MAEESAKQRSLAPLWIILFIGVGAGILGYTASLDEHRFYKPILESLGDGLMLLGLIDLFLQGELIPWLTRPSEIVKLYEKWKKVGDDLTKAQRELAEFNQKMMLENIQEKSSKTLDAAEEILKELKALKAQMGK